MIAISRIANTFHLNPIEVAKSDEFDIKFLIAANNLVAKETEQASRRNH